LFMSWSAQKSYVGYAQMSIDYFDSYDLGNA
jgi:hypothetical protein